MVKKIRDVINNQIFVGLPWKTVKPKYERAITKLEKKYPLYLTIVGRDDGQDAVNLFEVIKTRISTSSEAIFDATGGNPNVSLEYGYAEGLNIKKTIFVSHHGAAKKPNPNSPIISDLAGQRRVPYKTEKQLFSELDKLCLKHDFNKRFDNALKSLFGSTSRHNKKSKRALAHKLIRTLDGKDSVRRTDLVQHLQAQNYSADDINDCLKGLHSKKIINCAQGRYSDVTVG
jgi:hypothetical protein